jgi:chromosome segregation ATPase
MEKIDPLVGNLKKLQQRGQEAQIKIEKVSSDLEKISKQIECLAKSSEVRQFGQELEANNFRFSLEGVRAEVEKLTVSQQHEQHLQVEFSDEIAKLEGLMTQQLGQLAEELRELQRRGKTSQDEMTKVNNTLEQASEKIKKLEEDLIIFSQQQSASTKSVNSSVSELGISSCLFKPSSTQKDPRCTEVTTQQKNFQT